MYTKMSEAGLLIGFALYDSTVSLSCHCCQNLNESLVNDWHCHSQCAGFVWQHDSIEVLDYPEHMAQLSLTIFQSFVTSGDLHP